jgi:hypothetical protein
MRVRAVTVAATAPAHDRAINTGPADWRGCQWEPNMTASFTSTLRQAGLVLAFALSLSTLSATESFAFSAEAQAMCTGDAFRLCSADIPNIPKITACMFKHRAQLSVGCRNVMNRNIAKKSRKVAEAE